MPAFRRSAGKPEGIVTSLGRLIPFLAALALLPVAAQGQERSVVSSEISVSSDGTSLHLVFSNDDALSIEFSDGRVYIDGEEAGSYSRGDELEVSWRALLGQAVALDNGPLSAALRSWEPPSDLESDQAEVGDQIDQAIEGSLNPPEEARTEERDSEIIVSGDLDLQLLTSLLGRTERFIALSEALDDVDLDLEDLSSNGIRVHLNEAVSIDRDETVEATLILIDSDLDVQGHLDGNAILVGGSLTVGEDAMIDGEVHLADTRVSRDGGVVEGGINRIRLEREIVDAEAISELREEIADEIRREVRASMPRSEARAPEGVFGAFRHVARGVGGMMENLMTFAIVAVLAFAVVRFFGTNLEVVAEVARQHPARAGVVGVAGAFLLMPVWILGIVALAISLIGIPVLLAWIPLLPIAAILAMGLGFLAVANNVGDWVSKQRLQGFDWVRRSNALSVVLAGVATLLLPFFAANFILLAGDWLGFVRHLLQFIGCAAILIAMSVGFGAVLMTRGGRRREWAFADEGLDLGDDEWSDDFGSASTTVEAEPGPEVDEGNPTGSASDGIDTDSEKDGAADV